MFHQLALPVLAMPRVAKRVVVLVVDAALCVLTVWLAYYLRLGEWVKLSGDVVNISGDLFMLQPMWAVGASLLLAIPLFVVNGFYRAIFRYSGLAALSTIAKTIGIYALIFATIFSAIGIDSVPRTVGLIQPMLLLLAVGSTVHRSS
jgi:FlaA1/EpsC-like NDP-sugar epimerase